MAQVGLEYADDPYDEERYERILTLVSEWYGRSYDLPPEEVRQRFAEEVGYVTPKVCAEAVIFDSDGRLLLQKRTDDGTWCFPCGYTDPDESPAETSVRETREETGLTVEVDELAGIHTRKPGEHGPHCLGSSLLPLFRHGRRTPGLPRGRGRTVLAHQRRPGLAQGPRAIGTRGGQEATELGVIVEGRSNRRRSE